MSVESSVTINLFPRLSSSSQFRTVPHVMPPSPANAENLAKYVIKSWRICESYNMKNISLEWMMDVWTTKTVHRFNDYFPCYWKRLYEIVIEKEQSIDIAIMKIGTIREEQLNANMTTLVSLHWWHTIYQIG